MGLSKALKEKFTQFSSEDQDRLVRLGWEDRSSFEVIKKQFGLTQNEFIIFMRQQLDRKTFQRWRKRTGEHGHLKHETKQGYETSRFKCSRQSADGITKGWK